MIYDYIRRTYVRVKTKEKLYFNGYLDVNLDMGRGRGSDSSGIIFHGRVIVLLNRYREGRSCDDKDDE